MSRSACSTREARWRAAHSREETQATLFVAVGTAFGVPGVALGDVLVSERVLFYDDRRIDESNGQITERARKGPREASRLWVQRIERWAMSTAEAPRIVMGTLLSGGAVIESASYRDQLVGWHSALAAPSTIVGGEMEAAGLVAAADGRDWLLVKGVSDLADGTSRQDPDALGQQQQLAATRAAITILQTLIGSPREVDP
jgi:nucleoside phosphorylase